MFSEFAEVSAATWGVIVALLLVGVAMLCYGVWRGEADTVLSKAIRLCLECVGIG